MRNNTPIQYGIIALRLGLGVLFLYAGSQKFKPQTTEPRPSQGTEQQVELPEHVVKIKSFIGGMKQTGYFWPMLGIAEILSGILLLSQVYALLGAVMLVPLTLNIFLFEVFLGGGDVREIMIHGLYLIANLLIIAAGYRRLKIAFLTTEKQFHKIIKS